MVVQKRYGKKVRKIWFFCYGFSANQIAVLFYPQYLRKESINTLVFFEIIIKSR